MFTIPFKGFQSSVSLHVFYIVYDQSRHVAHDQNHEFYISLRLFRDTHCFLQCLCSHTLFDGNWTIVRVTEQAENNKRATKLKQKRVYVLSKQPYVSQSVGLYRKCNDGLHVTQYAPF